jgi:hypothetical protein
MKESKNKSQRLTAVTRDLGIWLNLKIVLYLENLCLTEKSRIFNPKPRVAPRRYRQTIRVVIKNKRVTRNLNEKI